MAGIYFHIPYCKQACHYCDFHFSTELNTRGEMLIAMQREIQMRLHRSEGESLSVSSIYFGGGTPSLLSPAQIAGLIEEVVKHVSLDPAAEITLEANPDDLSREKLQDWKAAGINRLSIGVQSFSDNDLKWMNRAHSAEEALHAVDRARSAGFQQLTIDLIYGLPHWGSDDWHENMSQLFALDVPHFSAYILTIEEKTVLGKRVKKGLEKAGSDGAISRQYEALCMAASTAGYEHYEVSNFARPAQQAIHNSAYWTGAHYLGFGPGAHSFNGVERRWNIASNPLYIKRMLSGDDGYWKGEILSTRDRYNEAVMTGLRTARGIDPEAFPVFGHPGENPQSAKAWSKAIAGGDLVALSNGWYRIPEAKWLFADRIAGDLFLV